MLPCGIRFSMRRLIGVVVFVLSAMAATAQKVQVLPEMKEIEGLRRKGMKCLAEYDKKTVEKAWLKWLKGYGKPDTWKGGAIVLLASANSSETLKDYDWITQLDATNQGTMIFWSLGAKGDYAEPGTTDYEQGKVLLEKFGRQLQMDDLQGQISAAENVAELASKTYDKTVGYGEQLKSQLARNSKARAQLLKDLDLNRQDSVRIKNDIFQNRTDQEASLDEIKKVRKIAEEKKLKLVQMQQ